MNPIASFGPQISMTLSPITISITPDCTMHMHEPGSPLLKTTLPAPKRHVRAGPLGKHSHVDFIAVHFRLAGPSRASIGSDFMPKIRSLVLALPRPGAQ